MKVLLTHEQIGSLPFAGNDYHGLPDGQRKPEGEILVKDEEILVRYLPSGYGQEWRILASGKRRK